MKARLTNTKLKGEARTHAEQHFRAAVLRHMWGDGQRLLEIYKDATSSDLSDPQHIWNQIHLIGCQAARAHARDMNEAKSLQYAVFEITEV